MTGRRFNRFSNSFTSRGSRFAASFGACNNGESENFSTVSLLSLDTALAVSIFAALRLIVIRLVGVILVLIRGDKAKRPCLSAS